MADSESTSSLFDPEVWTPALHAYGVVTHLTVQLYDENAKLRHGPTPDTRIFEALAGTGEAIGFASCAAECLTETDPAAVVVKRLPGLGIVGAPLRLAEDVVGAAVAGYVLTDVPATLELQRLARAHGRAFDELGDLAQGATPVPVERLTAYGRLLRVLGETLVREHARSRERARLYAAAQEANRIKDEFLSTVSHELRAPLSAIVGWTRVLRSKRDDRRIVDRALETIERNAKAQTRLIDDLLDVSRIVAGSVKLELALVDLIPLIEGAIEVVRPAAQARGIEIASELEVSVDRIAGDPDRLQQVLLNLLSNAVKFSAEGDHITVDLRGIDRHVEIRVSDTGQGIPPDFLPLIFDRFRQADGAATRRQGGLGLGLSIVRDLVKQHGGRVHAESPGEGRGATFTVTLPLPDLAQRSALEPAYLVRAKRSLERDDPRPAHALRGLRLWWSTTRTRARA
jgi:signal transduction histidine kinase